MLKSLIFSLIPLKYTFSSRIITKSERFSWFFIYPFFLIYVGVLFNLNLLFILFIFFSVMSIYEVGYLFNDIVTIKQEINPTIRVSKEKNHLYLTYFKTQVIVRLVFGFGVSGYFLYANNCFVVIGLIVILMSYYIHNSFRSKVNILSYFLLVSCRYLVPLSALLAVSNNIVVIICIILCFPLCRTIEHSCKKKYELIYGKYLSANFDWYRVVYYFIFTTLSFIFYVLNIIEFRVVLLFIYFLVIRGLFFLARKRVIRNKHTSY